MTVWRQLWGDLAFSRQRGIDALRITIAACVIIVIGQSLHLSHFYWGIITVYALAQATVGAVLMKSTFRLIGTSVGAALGVVTLALFVQHHVAMAIFMAAVFFVFFYHAAGKVAPYTFLIGAMTYVLVVYSTYPSPQEVTAVAPTRALEIAIGILVMGFCTLTLWPHYAGRAFHHRRAACLRQVAELHEFAWRQIRDHQPGKDEHGERSERQSDDLRQLPGLLEQTCAEDLAVIRSRPELERQIFWLERLQVQNLAARALLARAGEPSFLDEMRAETEALVEALATEARQLADAIEKRPDPTPPPRLVQAVRGVQAARRRLRETNRMLTFDPEANYRGETYLASLFESAELFARLHASIHTTSGELLRASVASTIRNACDSLLHATLHPNRRQLEAAAKGTLVLMIAFTLGQPGYLGDMTATGVSAAVFVSSGQVGATLLKALLRAAGCILGALFAAILVIVIFPHFSTLGALILACAPFYFVCSYLCTGNVNLNYVGFQAALCISLTAMASFAQPTDIDVMAYRLYGICCGMTLAWIVQTVFPQRTSHREVLTHAASFFAQMRDRLQRLDLGNPPANAPAPDADHRQAQAHLAAITSLNLTARLELEPNALRQGQASELVHRLERSEAVLWEMETTRQRPLEPTRLALMGTAWRNLAAALAAQCHRLSLELPKDAPRALSSEDSIAQALAAFREQLRHLREHVDIEATPSEAQLRTVQLFQDLIVLSARLQDVTALIRSGYDPAVTVPLVEASPASTPAGGR
ncbi:MAG: FUSC family protein [Verrucomicrobiota bacterium]